MRRIAIVAIAVTVGGGAMLASQPADAARRFTFTDEIEITAEVQKPQVAVFISRENLHKNYRLELRESFVPKILRSVEDAPF